MLNVVNEGASPSQRADGGTKRLRRRHAHAQRSTTCNLRQTVAFWSQRQIGFGAVIFDSCRPSAPRGQVFRPSPTSVVGAVSIVDSLSCINAPCVPAEYPPALSVLRASPILSTDPIVVGKFTPHMQP